MPLLLGCIILKKGNNITTPLHVSTNMQENYITFQWQHRSRLIGFGLAAVSFVFISGFRCTYQLGSCSAFPDERWLRSPSHSVARPQRLHSMAAWRRIERGGGAKSTRMRELSRWAMSEGSTQKAEGDTG